MGLIIDTSRPRWARQAQKRPAGELVTEHEMCPAWWSELTAANP
jgi:hypothetical protein